MKEIDFSTLATRCAIFPDSRSYNYLALIVTSCFTCAGVKITFQTLVNILCSVTVLTKPMIKANNANDGALA